MNRNTLISLTIALVAVLLATLLRILPHIPNFAPIGAIALFSGVMFRKHLWAMLLPLGALLLSDALLEVTNGTGFYSGFGWVYGSYVLVVLIGLLTKNQYRVQHVVAASLLASITFFLITNFGSWISMPIYTKDLAGLMQSYTAAVPFFRNTLLSDLAYTGLLFGSYYLITQKVPALRQQQS